jgi:YaiO family outer membrane protein
MIFQRRVILLLVLFTALVAIDAKAIASVLDDANRAVEQNNFDLAVTILDEHLKENIHDTDTRFLYARVLSWQGSYAEAIDQFNTLLADFPNNADYLLARANTYEWMGNRSQALDDLKTAREITPEYKLVWRTEIKLLVRAGDQESIKQAVTLVELAEIRFPEDEWEELLSRPEVIPVNAYSVEASYRYDHLTNNRSPWKAVALRLDMQTTDNHFAHASFESTDRFALSDRQIAAGYALPFAETWMIYAAGSYSPTHRVLANRSVELRLTKSFNNGFNLYAGLIHAKYTATTSQQALITGEYYWSDYRFSYTYRLVDVLNAGTGSNNSIQFNKYFSSGNYIGVALGAGEDVEFDGTATPPISDVVSFSLFGRYMVRPGWSLVYSYNYHEQGDLYSRNGFILGLRIDF